MRAYKIYASYSNDNNPTCHVICILCIYCTHHVRNMRKRLAVVKEVEVDRGTAAKSVPISYIYIQKHFEGHRTVPYH